MLQSPDTGKSQNPDTYAAFDSWTAEHGLSNYSLVEGGQAQQSLATPLEQLAPTEMLSPTQDPYACLTPPPHAQCGRGAQPDWDVLTIARLWLAFRRAAERSCSPPLGG